MTEFLDGVRDGAKGEVHDLTTVNFDAMELQKLLVDRNGWSARLTKLDQNKASVNAEIWKKLRNEYDQKLKARENELLTLRDKMRKKLDEMGKLKDAVEREFPGLQKRREELQLRYELGDFNQEFYDYVNRELTFQIEVRQKKVEVLGRNMAFYREALGSEDGVFTGASGQAPAVRESDESEAFGKGGSGPPQTVSAVTANLDETRRAVLPGRAAEPVQASLRAKPAPPAPPAAVAVLEEEPVPEESLTLPEAEAEDEEEEEAAADAAVVFDSLSAEDDDGLQNLPSEDLSEDVEEANTPPVAFEAPARDVVLAEPEDDVVAVPEEEDELDAPMSIAAADAASAVEEEEEVVEEVMEEIEESPSLLVEEEEEGESTLAVQFANVPAEEADELDEIPSPHIARADDSGVQELEEDVPEDLGVEDATEEHGSIGSARSSGLDTEEQGLLMDDDDLSLGDESLSGIDVDEDESAVTEAPWESSLDAPPSARVQAGIDAMEDMSDALARGAEADPEREEAKKILEEVNLEELERAVEGIEGDGEDEELRGFVRDVSGRRGESGLPPPAVLEVVEGINLGKVFPVSRTSSVTSIGKAPDNTIAMPEDKALSRYHAKIVFRQSKFVILDLDSTNGTGVNGEAITEADLQDEDEIIMGGSRYIFRITSRG